MDQPRDWRLERYRALLKLQVRELQLDPRFKRRFDSSDLVQDAYKNALANFDQFRGRTEAELVKWLQVILANVAAEEIRKAKAQKRDLGLEHSVQDAIHGFSARLEKFFAPAESSPSRRAEKNEFLLGFAAALDELPKDQRDVLILRDVDGTKVIDIAERLGRSEKSVAGLLRRGRHALRELLIKYE
jgi:RNA polymerase sigma-70 factor (ECF subfamily)